MCPTPMAKAPEPALAYVPIPKERYTSREFARHEWERMWTKVWLLAGRESDAPNPGDYFTFEIGPESVLVVRQRDGSLAARYNVCMHRGNRLREPGRGHAERVRAACSTAGSTTSTASCCAALDPECFPQGVPAEKLSLRPVRCETWAGFVFVCLDPNVGAAARLPRRDPRAPRPVPLRELEGRLRLHDRDRVQLEDLGRRLQRGLPPRRRRTPGRSSSATT